MRRRWFVALGLLVGLGAVAWAHAVDLEPTPEDQQALGPVLSRAGITRRTETSSTAGELRVIREVQRAILEAAPVNRGIPQGSSREPAQLLARKEGLCFDRSRTIEKALRILGFECRHVFIYSIEEGGGWAVLRPGVRSHAVTEVRTRDGWVVVDSNDPWLSVDARGRPRGIAEVHRDLGKQELEWPAGHERIQSDIYRKPFNYLYGLYSRHGRFYPPYNPLPDLSWTETWDNLRDR